MPGEEIVAELVQHGWQAPAALSAYWAFGSTIKAFGRVSGEWSETQLRNLFRIGEKSKHLQEQVDAESVERGEVVDSSPTGSSDRAEQLAEEVNARVSQRVIQEGAWLDDDVAQSYLAGMLIAGRSADGGRDQAVYWTNLAAALSSDAVRLHHILYTAFRQARQPIADANTRGEVRIRVPYELLVPEFPGSTPGTIHRRVAAAAVMLDREELITDLRSGPPAPEDESRGWKYMGLTVGPTNTGALLYLNAYGVKDAFPDDLIQPGWRREFDPPGPRVRAVHAYREGQPLVS